MIEGMDKLFRKLDRLGELSVEQPVRAATELIRDNAKSRCRADSGELRESIMTSVNEVNGDVVGICYTNKMYAPYVEFGTGPKGQASHNGISPDVPVAYTQTPWWIHESMIDKGIAEKYHWFSISTEKGRFYQCTGQPARPFLYPALKDNEDKVKEIIENRVKEALR